MKKLYGMICKATALFMMSGLIFIPSADSKAAEGIVMEDSDREDILDTKVMDVSEYADDEYIDDEYTDDGDIDDGDIDDGDIDDGDIDDEYIDDECVDINYDDNENMDGILIDGSDALEPYYETDYHESGAPIMEKEKVKAEKKVKQGPISVTLSSSEVDYADSRDDSLADEYTVTEEVMLRNGAGQEKNAITVLGKGVKVVCYGYYTMADGTRWLLVQCSQGVTTYTGFCSIKYLEK